jgi:hypothetical protein
MLDSPEGVCAGQAGSEFQLLPYPLVSIGARHKAGPHLERVKLRRPGSGPHAALQKSYLVDFAAEMTSSTGDLGL